MGSIDPVAGLVNGAFSWPRRSRGGQVNDLLRGRLADRLRALLLAEGGRRAGLLLCRELTEISTRIETPLRRGFFFPAGVVYCAFALRAASSASLRTVMTPIWLVR